VAVALLAAGPVLAAAPVGVALAAARVVSPDGTRWVSYEPFDPYPPAGVETAAVFHLGTVKGTAPPATVTVPGVGRSIDAVRWIDRRFVLVAADIASSILDAEMGTLAGQVYGLDFTVAPGAGKIAFRHGTVPRYFRQDDPPSGRVGLWYREDTAAGGAAWAEMEVYPQVRFPPSVDYGPPPLPERHLLRPGFAWSPSGRRLGFVEDHGSSRWLVVLDLESAPEGSVPAWRFAVPASVEDVGTLSWSADETVVQIDGPDVPLRWALETEGGGGGC
jgi:hypothetical protein